jgi:hypothetical protein
MMLDPVANSARVVSMSSESESTVKASLSQAS